MCQNPHPQSVGNDYHSPRQTLPASLRGRKSHFCMPGASVGSPPRRWALSGVELQTHSLRYPSWLCVNLTQARVSRWEEPQLRMPPSIRKGEQKSRSQGCCGFSTSSSTNGESSLPLGCFFILICVLLNLNEISWNTGGKSTDTRRVG